MKREKSKKKERLAFKYDIKIINPNFVAGIISSLIKCVFLNLFFLNFTAPKSVS